MKTVGYYRGRQYHVREALECEQRWPIEYKHAVYLEKGTGCQMRPVRVPTEFFRYLPGQTGGGGGNSSGESIAHEKAKEILCERTSIAFETFGKRYAFSFVGPCVKEQPFIGPKAGGDHRIDVVAELHDPAYPLEGQRYLAMEIKIGHPLDPPKKAELRIAQFPTIEITLPEELASYTDEDTSHQDYELLVRRLRGLLLKHTLSYTDWVYPHSFNLRDKPAPKPIVTEAPQPVPVTPLIERPISPPVAPVTAATAISLNTSVPSTTVASRPPPPKSAWRRLTTWLSGLFSG